MPESNMTEPAPERERRSPALWAVRYGIGGAMVLGGIVTLAINPGGFGVDGFAMAVGGGLSVLMINALYRLGVSGDEERARHEDAWRYFEEHGEWPDDPPPRKRQWTLPAGAVTFEAEQAARTTGAGAQTRRCISVPVRARFSSPVRTTDRASGGRVPLTCKAAHQFGRRRTRNRKESDMFLPRIKTALAVAGVAAALPAAATAAHHHRLGGEAPTVYTYGYSGGADVVRVPASASAVCIVAKGGDGAGFTDSFYDHTGGGGAVISGCLPVTSRDTLLVAPGAAGHMANTRGASDSLGGWGYGGAEGGGGHLGTGADGSPPGFPSGGGGGATIVQLNGQDIIVAAGGGGQGGGGDDEADGGSGGSAGPVAQSGGTASSGSAPGGAGGAASGPAGGPGLPSPWSDQFASYSWGGGGGGGVNGGGGAVGSQFAGPDVDTGGNGGGAGSSMIDAQAIHGTIESGTPGQNLDGVVKLTFVPQLTYQLTPSASSVTAGGTVTVPLTGTTSDGQSFPLGVSGFTWSTKITPSQGDVGNSPDKVAGDQITMYQAGVHTVTAYLNGAAVASAQVSVTAAATQSTGVSADPAELTAGHSAAFQVTAYDAYGNPTGDLTTGAKLTSNVTSDAVNGAHVKFVAAGTHTIKASVDGYTAITTVQVDPAAAVSATLAPLDSGTSVDSGTTVYFELTGQDAYGNQFTLGPSQFTLTDSGFGDSIDANTIQFGQAGQRTITAYLTGTTVTAQLGMTVLPGLVSSLKLAPSATTITAGQSVTVDVTGLDASGDSLGPIDPSGVAMILSPTTGVTVAGNEFTFADPGTYYINAYLKSDESVIGNTVITVNPATEAGAPAPVPTPSHHHHIWRHSHERRLHATRDRAA